MGWKKIRELMKVMEAYQDAKSENQRSSSSISRSMQTTRADKVGSAWQGSRITDTPDTASEHYLQLPNIDSDDNKTDSMASMARERRMRKHREKKNRKQREKQVKNRGFLPSTMGGRTGEMKVLYA